MSNEESDRFSYDVIVQSEKPKVRGYLTRCYSAPSDVSWPSPVSEAPSLVLLLSLITFWETESDFSFIFYASDLSKESEQREEPV